MKQRFNRGDITKDAVYIDAELRFTDLERETKKLHDESQKYFMSVNGMMDHQIEFSRAVKEIYQPISGRASDRDSYVIDGNPEGIRACEEYEAIVNELKANLQPELEMIETRIVKPAEELMEVIKAVRKMATKRDHKQLDYDSTKNKLKKLQDKKEKSAKDEKDIWNTENKLEQVTEDYHLFNEAMKKELLELFALEKEFISPLFQSFYFMQLNVYYTLNERMESIDIGYFDLTDKSEQALLDGYTAKKGDVQEQIEAIPMVKFKTTGQRRPGTLGSKYQNRLTAGPSASRLAIENGRASSPANSTPGTPTSPAARRLTYGSEDGAPPPYSAGVNGDIGRSASTGSNWTSAAKGKAAPPPPKPKPGRLSGNPNVETVTALYEYKAQAEGDLAFQAGDVIEVITRTENVQEWWVGKINGRQGQFPGESSSP